ncbi:hypothetical protein SAMN02745857_02023 [Andreprevotia lacus DSM 23236]|jgi:hypothetical protein|uniref:CHAP domain-containing protein n=1 Tax=Andreprevotia lacus DSM 23236 TaxID=1121001 RepID=A0A1W1XM88_9NEIS|nr:hypothetical protein [Andreprevotia lacus]SMC24972.1 hypothetical protein SAMN02745857_02023 [Andreprevotia lacus DSM 23236]
MADPINETAARIIAACESNWDAWKSDCSGFLKAVASDLGVLLQGNANAIGNYLENAADWQNLGTDKATAQMRANSGMLVVGSLNASGHGHVVVIVATDAAHVQPVGYWGRFGSVGRKNTTINYSWNNADLAQVKFYARTIF